MPSAQHQGGVVGMANRALDVDFGVAYAMLPAGDFALVLAQLVVITLRDAVRRVLHMKHHIHSASPNQVLAHMRFGASAPDWFIAQREALGDHLRSRHKEPFALPLVGAVGARETCVPGQRLSGL